MRRTPDPFKWRLSSSLRSFRLPPEEEDAGEFVRLKIIFATLPADAAGDGDHEMNRTLRSALLLICNSTPIIMSSYVVSSKFA